MNVAKNWALTIMLIALTFRSFLERTVVERAKDQSGFHLTVERDWFWFWFYYALRLASVFTLVLVLRQSSENRSIPATKTFTDAGHIDAKLTDFNQIYQKIPAKSAVFY